MVSGTATAFVLFACAPFIGGIIDSSSVGLGLKWASAGILFFTLNKVLLASLNGQRKIKLYCIIQMLRSLLMFMCVVFIVLKNMPAYMLGIVFTFSEVAVLVPLVFLNFYPRLVLPSFGQLKQKIKNHLRFSVRAFPNALLAEAYLKLIF